MHAPSTLPPRLPAEGSAPAHALFRDLVRLHGEQNGGLEDFYLIDETTIGCRYGDCCIRLKEGGWRYGRNVHAHRTPALAFENRAYDEAAPGQSPRR